jgi:hypothetical protein
VEKLKPNADFYAFQRSSAPATTPTWAESRALPKAAVFPAIPDK